MLCIDTICDQFMKSFAVAMVSASPDSPVGRARAVHGDRSNEVAIVIIRDEIKAMITGPEYETERRDVLDGIHLASDALFTSALASAMRRFGESAA